MHVSEDLKNILNRKHNNNRCNPVNEHFSALIINKFTRKIAFHESIFIVLKKLFIFLFGIGMLLEE